VFFPLDLVMFPDFFSSWRFTFQHKRTAKCFMFSWWQQGTHI